MNGTTKTRGNFKLNQVHTSLFASSIVFMVDALRVETGRLGNQSVGTQSKMSDVCRTGHRETHGFSVGVGIQHPGPDRAGVIYFFPCQHSTRWFPCCDPNHALGSLLLEDRRYPTTSGRQTSCRMHREGGPSFGRKWRVGATCRSRPGQAWVSQ